MKEADYIGDGVYVREGDYHSQICIYLDNGYGPYSEIYLEDDMLEQLIKFRDRMNKKYTEGT